MFSQQKADEAPVDISLTYAFDSAGQYRLGAM
jgi:hypothetical protein